MNDKLGALIKDYREAKDLYDEKNEELKQIKKVLDALNMKVLDVMEELGLEKVSTEFGTASKKIELYPNITDMEEFLAFCVNENYPNMIQKRVSAPAFREFYDQQGYYPDGLDAYDKKTLLFRRK